MVAVGAAAWAGACVGAAVAGALVGAGSELVTEFLLGAVTISPAELADYLTSLAFAMIGIRPGGITPGAGPAEARS